MVRSKSRFARPRSRSGPPIAMTRAEFGRRWACFIDAPGGFVARRPLRRPSLRSRSYGARHRFAGFGIGSFRGGRSRRTSATRRTSTPPPTRGAAHSKKTVTTGRVSRFWRRFPERRDSRGQYSMCDAANKKAARSGSLGRGQRYRQVLCSEVLGQAASCMIPSMNFLPSRRGMISSNPFSRLHFFCAA